MNSFLGLLVSKFSQVKDVIGDTVVDPGYISIRNQLENRIAYLKRPTTANRKSTAVNRRLVKVKEEGPIKTLAATLRGSRPGVQSASLITTSLMTS